ncbi:MAG: methenyltetrahydromethanopterin cyclohydrolase [Pseudomonadota bacterium]|nr:methenyltetrahydromethanopterin cyclohydrolase [Pseudomonadota bacterium]
MEDRQGRPIVGRLAAPLVERLITEALHYRVSVSEGPRSARFVDAGAKALGGIEAGLLIAEICMGGLGHAGLAPSTLSSRWPWTIHVRAADPVLACLGSQYAGWALSAGEGDGAYRAMGSGPVRAAAARESIFEEIGYRDSAERNVLVLETGSPPPESIVTEVAEAAGCEPGQLTVIYAPTDSLAGSTQVVARVLEVALHKAHALHFPLERIVDGVGAAPLAPPAPDFVAAMGRTNDAIIYGGQVHLFVTGPDQDAKELAERLPSTGSRDYGAPFAEIFARAGGDFYAIDSMLFSPASAIVTCLDSGRSHRGGRISPELLDASFG